MRCKCGKKIEKVNLDPNYEYCNSCYSWSQSVLEEYKQSKQYQTDKDGIILKSVAHPEPNGLNEVFYCSKDSLETININKENKDDV